MQCAGIPGDSSEIPIDPLTILPLPSAPTSCTGIISFSNQITYSAITVTSPLNIAPLMSGTRILKDEFAKQFTTRYDLTAPDFSYLIITELQDFYSTRQHYVDCCRNTILSMVESLDQFSIKFTRLIDNLCYTIHKFQYGHSNSRGKYFYNLADWLQRILFNTNADSNLICDIADSRCHFSSRSTTLHELQQIPSLLKVNARH